MRVVGVDELTGTAQEMPQRAFTFTKKMTRWGIGLVLDGDVEMALMFYYLNDGSSLVSRYKNSP